MLGAVFDGLTLVVAAVFRWIADSYQDTPEPLPPSPRTLVRNRKLVLKEYPMDRVREWRISRRPPSFLARILPLRPYDIASASFYRIYEFAVFDDNIRFRNEIEYFCHRQWPVSSLSDPCDFDPERLAFLAALTRILCASFNSRVAMGLHRDVPAYVTNFEELRARPKVWETPPQWAQNARALDRPLCINASQGDPELSSHLGEMGIIMKAPHYLFT